MNYYTRLKLDLQPLKDGIDCLDYVQNIHKHTLQIVKHDLNLLNTNLLGLLNSLGIHIVHLESFFTLPNTETTPHIDLYPGDLTKLNFVYLGNGSTMNWYHLKPGYSIKKSITSIGTPYFYAGMQDIEKMHSGNLQGPFLVQVGVLHNISNAQEERYCISCVIVNKNRQRLTYNDALEKFANLI